MADMNAATAVLKVQLEKALAEVKDLQEQVLSRVHVLQLDGSSLVVSTKQQSAMRSSLEASKAESASTEAALHTMDSQIDELKSMPAGMEEGLEQTRVVQKATANELEALHTNSMATSDICKARSCLSLIAQNHLPLTTEASSENNMKSCLSLVAETLVPSRKQLGAMQAAPATMEEEFKKKRDVHKQTEIEKLKNGMQSINIAEVKCKTIEADSLERAIELANSLLAEWPSSSVTDHKSISNASGGTTVGISFNDKDASVTACMVGGPAFNSKQVHQNDVIIAIDGQEVKGPEILDLLIGNDKPGSVVELTLKRASVGSCTFAFSVL
jgi:hypothetical protein